MATAHYRRLLRAEVRLQERRTQAETRLQERRAQAEAASRWQWLFPLLPRILGGPPSPVFWRMLTDPAGHDGDLEELAPAEYWLELLITFERHRPPERQTVAEVGIDMRKLADWEQAAPADAWERLAAAGSAALEDAAIRDWWDARPVPIPAFWEGEPLPPPVTPQDRAALLARLDAGDLIMADIMAPSGQVAERVATIQWEAPDWEEGLRLLERVQNAQDALPPTERAQTLENLRQWLESM